MNTRRNIPAALAGLAIYSLLVVAFPSTAIAQGGPDDPEENPDTVCGRCAWSDDRPWPSTECRAGLPAVPNYPDRFCVTWDGGGTEYCRYQRKKACPETQNGLALDLEAVGNVIRGEVLPPDGNHFFFASAEGDAAVMRKCDLSVVAWIPAKTLGIAAARRKSAIRVG